MACSPARLRDFLDSVVSSDAARIGYFPESVLVTPATIAGLIRSVRCRLVKL